MDNISLTKIKKEIKKNKKENIKNKILKYINKVLVVVLFTLFILTMLKSNEQFKTNFYSLVFEKNFSFVQVNEIYKKYFNDILPINLETEQQVFEETLVYNDTSIYLDGVKLIVDSNYLVPVLENGMVIFIGEKEGYGETVIVEQVNGIETWYSNITNLNVKMYDYIEKGSFLGEAIENNLYLTFKDDGKVIDYKTYIR